jgi:hypothetical protein
MRPRREGGGPKKEGWNDGNLALMTDSTLNDALMVRGNLKHWLISLLRYIMFDVQLTVRCNRSSHFRPAPMLYGDT